MSTTSVRPAGAATRVRAAAPGVVTRRRLELALGGIWLLDGALQFQPSMFSKSFFANLAALAAGMALAVTYGLFGQDLGGLLTGRATDPGTAPLLVLFALALWPRRHETPGTISPAG